MAYGHVLDTKRVRRASLSNSSLRRAQIDCVGSNEVCAPGTVCNQKANENGERVIPNSMVLFEDHNEGEEEPKELYQDIEDPNKGKTLTKDCRDVCGNHKVCPDNKGAIFYLLLHRMIM